MFLNHPFYSCFGAFKLMPPCWNPIKVTLLLDPKFTVPKDTPGGFPWLPSLLRALDLEVCAPSLWPSFCKFIWKAKQSQSVIRNVRCDIMFTTWYILRDFFGFLLLSWNIKPWHIWRTLFRSARGPSNYVLQEGTTQQTSKMLASRCLYVLKLKCVCMTLWLARFKHARLSYPALSPFLITLTSPLKPVLVIFRCRSPNNTDIGYYRVDEVLQDYCFAHLCI